MTRIRGDLRERTFDFACGILALSSEFPHDPRGWVLSKQIIRSGTSIGANVREADNALTDADFSHKCGIARKEAAETHYWPDLCTASGVLPATCTEKLLTEADELAKILSTIVQKTQDYIRK
jgi:four helix bundle protein